MHDSGNVAKDQYSTRRRKKHSVLSDAQQEAVGLNHLNIWVRKYPFLKNYFTSGWAVSNNILYTTNCSPLLVK